MSISTSLHRAALLQEKIDELRGQLATLLDQARAEMNAEPMAEVPTDGRRARGAGRRKARRGRRSLRPALAKPPAGQVKRGRKAGQTIKPKGLAKAARVLKAVVSPLAGRKRSSSPTGPLAPAVVKVLKAKGGAMNVKSILDGLLSAGYKFNTAEPKKNLAARIYRLKGVKKVSGGLFGLA